MSKNLKLQNKPSGERVNVFTLVIFMKVDNHIVDACVEFFFLKKDFLNLTINMQLLYFITTR